MPRPRHLFLVFLEMKIDPKYAKMDKKCQKVTKKWFQNWTQFLEGLTDHLRAYFGIFGQKPGFLPPGVSKNHDPPPVKIDFGCQTRDHFLHLFWKTFGN